MTVSQVVHHARYGYGQILSIRDDQATVRFAATVATLSTITLNAVRTFG